MVSPPSLSLAFSGKLIARKMQNVTRGLYSLTAIETRSCVFLSFSLLLFLFQNQPKTDSSNPIVVIRFANRV